MTEREDDHVVKYQNDLHVLAIAACTISLIDIPGYLKAIERVENTAWFLDPTLYQEKGEAMRQDKELLQAALPLYQWAQKWKKEVEREKGGEA